MKSKRCIIFLFLILFGTIQAQEPTFCTNWKLSAITQLSLPVFSENPSVDGKKFDQAAWLESVQPETATLSQWTDFTVGHDSIVTLVQGKDKLVQLAGFFHCDRWTKASLNLSTNAIYEVYMNGKKIKTQSKPADHAVKIELTAELGSHQLLIKLITVEDTLKLTSHIEAASKDKPTIISWSTDPQRTLSINDILEGESVSAATVSPSGKYLFVRITETLSNNGKTQTHSRIYHMDQKRHIFSLRNTAVYASWMPSSDRLYYTVRKDEITDIYVYDPTSGDEQLVASGLKSPGRIVWSPDESYFIYTKMEEASKTGDLKRVFTNDDRIPNTRNRSYLHMYDLRTRISRQLTAGNLSVSLHDIKPDGTKILFSVSVTDYTEIPFSRQSLYEMDVQTMQLDTIWKDKLYGGYCKYSTEGDRLLVSGSPETFGELGVKVSEGRIPNVSDRQLYLYELNKKEAQALTLDFDPAVRSSYWSKDGWIYLTAVERDYVNFYKYDLNKKRFLNIKLPVEVIQSVDFAVNKPLAVYTGSSISTPQKLFALDLKTGKSTLLLSPKEQQLKDVHFGQTEEWNFVNERGITIYGRIYYPIGYNPQKKYPVIVNFYGGTSPTDRTFGGRYPKNIWAANGYLVYVLQPSGATGFGQDFSALHVNGWGREAIDDIIEGTQKFLEAHPSADAENIGCIGASYGGYTTMLLQTRTDLFKTAIAHAGISDITSYWGEGYWGYSYSTGATKGSYPWNRRDIYVDNSPLFNADKFQNSILLLHGTSDTNVPVGESLQYYAALKILGKNVEMVLVSGENHHIIDYKKRIEWHQTIMAWFDNMLKDQPEQWKELYPEKHL